MSLLFLFTLIPAIGMAQAPVVEDLKNPLKPEPTTETSGPELLKLLVTITDKATSERLEGVQVQLINDDGGQVVDSRITDDYGLVEFVAPLRGDYRVETCEPRYLGGAATLSNCNTDPFRLCIQGFDFVMYEDAIASLKSDHIIKTDMKLDRLEVGKIVDLDRIYYDFDKATLRPKSKNELNELVRALEILPSLKIQLRSHTDSRGSNDYNRELSQRRAESVVNYLVGSGIDRSRFTARGFGESELLNECADGVECTEAQHQRNRRTSFEILSYEPKECE